MKKFIFSVSVFLLSVPLLAQTNVSGASVPTSPVSGAPILEPANTSAVPPTTINNTGAETAGTGSGTFSFDNPNTGTNQGTGTASQGIGLGTSTGLGTGTSSELGTGANFGSPSSTPVQSIPPATGTTQPSGSIMNGPNAPMGSGWQGR